MPHNSRDRYPARQAAGNQSPVTSLADIAQTINKVEKFGSTASTIASYVKPANRNVIGLIGAAAVLYWILTSDSK